MAGETSTKVGFVDTQRLLSETKASKKGDDFIQTIGIELDKELKTIQAEFEKDKENKELEQHIIQTHAFMQKRLQVEKQNVIQQLNQVFAKVTEAYRAENKLDYIAASTSTLAYNKSLDITSEIINLANKEEISFSAITSNENAPKYIEK